MSYIINNCLCNFCNEEIDYYWISADGKFEKIPNKEKYVCADHMEYGDTYVDSMSCPYCGKRIQHQYAIG